MKTRTTPSLVDRRLAAKFLEGIPSDLPEEVVRRHLRSTAELHRVIGCVARADLTRVDLAELERMLDVERLEYPAFANGVLGRVHLLGGQFKEARVVTLPGGETLGSLRQKNTIKFWTDWQFKPEEQSRLSISPTIGGQVLYLPDVVEGSLGCTCYKVKGRKSCQDVLDSLPKIEGLDWIIGNSATICQVLANHLEETGKYLLPYNWTWTVDSYDHPKYGLCRLRVSACGVEGAKSVGYLDPRGSSGVVGLFVLGVPY